MMSVYTKGPWILDGVEIRASDSHPIDRICDMAPGFNEDDAQLIATSPELLEALKMLETTCGDGLEIDHPIRVYARSVISKATTIQ